jgi:hypothetical protein
MPRQAFGIEQAEICALAEVRAHGMRGIPEKHDATIINVSREFVEVSGEHHCFVPANLGQRLLCLGQKGGRRRAPFRKRPGADAFQFGAVQAPEKCAAPFTQRQQPRKPACAMRRLLDEVADRLATPVAPERAILVIDAPSTWIQDWPQARACPVASCEKIEWPMLRAVGRACHDGAGRAPHFHNFGPGANVHPLVLDRLTQNSKEDPAMHSQRRLCRILQMHQFPAAMRPSVQSAHHGTARGHRVEQSHRAQHALAGRLQQKAGAHWSELRGALQQSDSMAQARQQHRERASGNAKADNADV